MVKYLNKEVLQILVRLQHFNEFIKNSIKTLKKRQRHLMRIKIFNCIRNNHPTNRELKCLRMKLTN